MILIAYGTRPEYIKLKPIIDLLGNKCSVLFTGQHPDLVDAKYDYRVSVYGIGNRLDTVVSSVMGELGYILKAEPWITHVMVQGDTVSALAVALSAFNHGLQIIHIEAGLRTWDLNNPYPEEGYRRMISQIANMHFCPTPDNAMNVLKCGQRHYIVGNTIIDSLVEYKNKCEYGKVVLVTMHRRENHEMMAEWFKEIEKLAEEHDDLEFIFPIHPNPNVSKHVELLNCVKAVAPMSRHDFLNILVKSRLVITDSGGVQEECSFFNKKCLVCRTVTEREESLGESSFLVFHPDLLNGVFNSHINDYRINVHCPYGDGHSAVRIYNLLMNELDDYSANSEYPTESRDVKANG